MKVRKERFWELHWPLIGLIVLVAGLGVYNLHSAAAAHLRGHAGLGHELERLAQLAEGLGR